MQQSRKTVEDKTTFSIQDQPNTGEEIKLDTGTRKQAFIDRYPSVEAGYYHEARPEYA
jgi:hypothetical protein